MSLERITKRDGRQVPFDEAKIHAAIAKAMAAVGEPDDGFAGEVAGVVRMTLDDRHSVAGKRGHPPHIEEIQDLVEQALIELGRGPVAKAYILYRDQRARVRRALEVHESGARAPSGSLRVQVRESGGTTPWSKGRIVAALMREAELSREVADKIAARVEERVFGAGLARISTALVRELVDNELVGLGLSAALLRHASFGLPAYDLRRMIEAPPREPDPSRAAPGEVLFQSAVEGRVSAEVLRRFALQEVLGDELAELHLGGDLHVHELGRPHLALGVSLPASALGVTSSPEDAFDRLRDAAALARHVAHGVVLEEPGPLLTALTPGRGSGLGTWLRAVAATARGAERRIDLAGLGGRSPALARHLVSELARLEDDAYAPRLFLETSELEGLLADGLADGDGEGGGSLDRLLLAGRVVPTWSSDGSQLVGPGCQRAPGERAAITSGGAVSINLARLALRAGPWREDRMLELVASMVERAMEALGRLQAFRRSERPISGRVVYAIAPVGLREALVTLGDGEIVAEQGARILGLMGEAAARAGAAQRMVVSLSPFFGESAAARFASLDARLPHHGQRLLFAAPDEAGETGQAGGGAAGAAPADQPYSTGYRLASDRPGAPGALAHGVEGWADEAVLCSTVAVGALHPLPAGPHDRIAAARTWLEFERRRSSADAGLLPRPPAPEALSVPLFPEPAPEAASVASTPTPATGSTTGA